MSEALGLPVGVMERAALIVDETDALLDLLKQLQVMAMEDEAMTTKVRMARLLCATVRARTHGLHADCGAAKVCGYVAKPAMVRDEDTHTAQLWMNIEAPRRHHYDGKMAAANDDTFRD
jgi:hypothetical protein